ncbi:MAG: DHH family phosphoesterase [Lachnospiraceae bacterium]|nr:DHH family phosphoesterase [Lachnospiraceae bacterium]
MKLSDLLAYDDIVVQCHDNPDADAIASGFGVYTYLKSRGKKVQLIYGGRFLIQKSNLVLMVEELQIPIEHKETLELPELLITVDCQYGEGNVTRFETQNVAVIDHHQICGELPELNEVRSNLASCSTIVWDLLEKEKVNVNEDKNLATALYYGLMTDSNNFTEVSHPLDKDLRDDAEVHRHLIVLFRNSNLSLEELTIAGDALMNYHYDERYRYAVVIARPCDPNVLGIISDMVLEVAGVDTCLVYSVQPFGIKVSVRSCVKEVRADELVRFIVKDIGSGGGHLEKAGGFIQTKLAQTAYEEFCKSHERAAKEEFKEAMGDLLDWRMTDYFDDIEIIRTERYQPDLSEMKAYKKRPIPVGFVMAKEILPCGTEISIRTLEGDVDVQIHEELYIMIGIKGEVYPCEKEKFERSYRVLEEPYVFDAEYEPMIKHTDEGKNISLIPYAKACVPTGDVIIYTKPLDHRVKVFTTWDVDKYMLGTEGDYLAVRADDLQDAYIIDGAIFDWTYEAIEE